MKSTYSQLIKPALNSASSPFSPGDDWDPSLTLGWSNRGIGSSKIGVLRDTLLANAHLTGVKLAGVNRKCVDDGTGHGLMIRLLTFHVYDSCDSAEVIIFLTPEPFSPTPFLTPEPTPSLNAVFDS